MVAIKFPIQAEKKACGFCHFLEISEQSLWNQEKGMHEITKRYWCEAFAQAVETDKKNRPQRIEDCLRAEL